MRVGPSPAPQIRERDRSAEIQPEAPTQQAPQPLGATSVALPTAPAAVHGVALPQAGRTHLATQSVLDIQRANEAQAAGALDREAFQKELTHLVGSLQEEKNPDGSTYYAFSPAAQKEFLHYIDVHATRPEDKVWAATKLRESLPTNTIAIGHLRHALNCRGIKLFRNDRLPGDHCGIELDRHAFKAELNGLEAAGGTVDKRATRQLLARFKDVADVDDLLWAQRQIDRRVQSGQLHFATPELQQRVEQMFADKTAGHVATAQLSDAVVQMRKDGFSAASIAAFEDLVGKCKNDSDAVFHAERVLDTNLQEAINAASKNNPSEVPRLEALRKQFDAFFAPKLAGRIDHHAMRAHLRKMLKDGTVSVQQAAELRAALTTSDTPEEFAQASMVAFAQLQEMQTAEEMMQAWDKLYEDMQRNMSDDTYDAEGHLIETAEQRAVRRLRHERLIERTYIAPAVRHELAQRAFLKAGIGTVRAKLAAAANPSERASLRANIDELKDAMEDLERPMPPG